VFVFVHVLHCLRRLFLFAVLVHFILDALTISATLGRIFDLLTRVFVIVSAARAVFMVIVVLMFVIVAVRTGFVFIRLIKSYVL